MASRQWILRRGSARSGFRYFTENGSPVRSRAVLERVEGLRIPPAYRDVHVSVSPRAPIQAWGFDARGRRQYRYHPRAVERGQLRKYYRVARLGRDLADIRAALDSDFRSQGFTKQRVAACAVRLISAGYLRAGDERYEAENRTYGAATLHKSHVTIDGRRIMLRFTGKRGITQEQEVSDPRLAAFIAKLKKTPGRRLFRYQTDDASWCDLTLRDVNLYLRELVGVRYTAKDFRTWGGTLRCAVTLAELGPAPSQRAAKRNVVAAVRAVASTLGNTPAISRKSYVHPLVIDLYLDRGLTISEYMHSASGSRPNRREHLRAPEETALIRFLDEHFPDRRRAPRKVA